MKDRIRQIMESQHMTQKVFADFIGTTSATLSGIFNERTQPTLNIVELIKKKIPDINTDWLLFGRGDMYLAPTPEGGAGSPGSGVQSSGSQPKDQMIDFMFPPASAPSSSAPTPQSSAPAQPRFNGVQNTRPVAVRDEMKFLDKPKRHVTEIRVYYDDQTWESFVPSKK